MKPISHPNERKPGMPWLLFVLPCVVLLVCLINTGCVSYRKDKPSGQTAPQVTVLGESFEMLKQEFNASTSKPRLMALFSPT